MKKITATICLIITAITLSSCQSLIRNRTSYNSFWEREKLSSNLHITGQGAKDLLDIDLSECLSITEKRQDLESKTLTTKKCKKKNGQDWNKADNSAFLNQCMQRRGWIPSNCCAFRKGCACN